MALLKTAQDIANEIAEKNAVELLGLPPGNTAMDRARALGFDVDNVYYHGTDADIPFFDNNLLGTGAEGGGSNQAHFFAADPTTANTYTSAPYEGRLNELMKERRMSIEGGYSDYPEINQKIYDLKKTQGQGESVYPVLINKNKQSYTDAEGKDYFEYMHNDISNWSEGQNAINLAKRYNKDSLRIDNLSDTYTEIPNPTTHMAVMNPSVVRSKFAAFDPRKFGVGAGAIMSTSLLASEADKNKKLEEDIAKYGELKAPERNSVLGLIADVGKFTLPDWLNSAPSLLDDMSYGYSGVKNVSGYPTPDTRFIDMADFIPAAGAAGMIKNLAKGQKYTSAATSINKEKLPAVFTKLTKEEKFAPGSRNIDIGGGKFDNASEHLAKQDVENLVFDPYNRSADHNRMVLESVRGKPADTATVSNVLNVIPDEANQIKTLETAYKSLKDDGEVFITVYEGNKSGVGKVTGSDQFQQNKKLSGYLDTVRKVFPNATVKGGMIRATK